MKFKLLGKEKRSKINNSWDGFESRIDFLQLSISFFLMKIVKHEENLGILLFISKVDLLMILRMANVETFNYFQVKILKFDIEGI